MLDLVVVGGGPAGSAAAVTAARAGRSVAVVEGCSFPRHRPGESLHPGAEPLLRRLGVWDALAPAGRVRYAGITVRDGAGERFSAFGADAAGAWLGIQLPRADLDAALLAAAIRAGCRVHQPARAVAVLTAGGRVCGVRLADGTEVSARWTIDAGGGRHWLARRIGVPIERRSVPLVVRYGYASGECPRADSAPTFARDRVGWTWTARVAPGLYHWTRLRPTGEPVETPPEFAGLRPVGPVRAADVTWRAVGAAAGPGYFLAGDAAMVLDPSGANGVLRGLMTGMMAGHAVARVGGGLSERIAGSEYSHWASEVFQTGLARLSAEFPHAGLGARDAG